MYLLEQPGSHPLSVHCTSAKCDWQRHYSLGICSHCEDVTPQTNGTWDCPVPESGYPFCTYQTPHGISLMASTGVTSSSIDVIPVLNVTTSTTRIKQDLVPDSVLLTFAILRMKNTGSSHMPPFQDAHECSLKWCVKAYDRVSTTLNSPLDYVATSSWDIAVPPRPSEIPNQDNFFHYGEGWWKNDAYNKGGGRQADYVVMDVVNDTCEYTGVAKLIGSHMLKHY